MNAGMVEERRGRPLDAVDVASTMDKAQLSVDAASHTALRKLRDDEAAAQVVQRRRRCERRVGMVRVGSPAVGSRACASAPTIRVPTLRAAGGGTGCSVSGSRSKKAKQVVSNSHARAGRMGTKCEKRRRGWGARVGTVSELGMDPPDLGGAN